MAKRWKIEDDMFLCFYQEVGANYVANHDLGFQGKNAGNDRLQKLKDLGILEKIEAYHVAKQAMHDAWTMAFGPEWAKEIVEDRSKEEDFPWIEHGVRTGNDGSLEFYSTKQVPEPNGSNSGEAGADAASSVPSKAQ